MIAFFVLLLLVAGIISNVLLLVNFPQQNFRHAILKWALGAPILTFALLYTLRPLAGLFAFIIVVGLCAFIVGPVTHVSFLRWFKAEGASGEGSAFASLLFAVSVCVLLVLLATFGVFSYA